MDDIKGLHKVIVCNNHLSKTGNRVSEKTQSEREYVLKSGFNLLNSLDDKKYKINNIKNLHEKHLEKLVIEWFSSGLSIKSIHTHISKFRALYSWVGKSRNLKTTKDYLGKNYSNKKPKKTDWPNIDIKNKLAEIKDTDRRVYLQLRLIYAFSLNVKDAMTLRPHMVDKGDHLILETKKSKLERIIFIDDDYQKETIEESKRFCHSRTDSMTLKGESILNWKPKFYKVCSKFSLGSKYNLSIKRLNEQYQLNS